MYIVKVGKRILYTEQIYSAFCMLSDIHFQEFENTL